MRTARATLLALTTLLALSLACSPNINGNGKGNGHGNGNGDPKVKRSFESALTLTLTALRQADAEELGRRLGELQRAAQSAPQQAVVRDLRQVASFLAGELPGSASIERTLNRWLDREALTSWSRLPATTAHGGYVHTRLALLTVHGADEEQGLARARSLRGQVSEERYRRALDRVVKRIEQRRSARGNTIGVLLPLSGPYRAIGEAALRSIKLALGRRVKLRVEDTRGDDAAAARLVDKLVFQDNVIGILGPVGQFESTAAARRAAELKVPIVVLTNRVAIAQHSPWVFQTRLTASIEGVRLARYAVHDMKIKSFGLLISDSDYGWPLAGAFWDEVVRLGGTVTAAWAYPRGSTDYRGMVRKLVGGPRKRGRRAKVAFRGLLVADNYATVRKVVPFFPYWGLAVRRHPRHKRRIQLLGGSGWNHPLIVDQAEQQTDNAVFCDSFFTDETNRRVERFVNTFYAKYREPPVTFHAEVYDAAQVIYKAARKDKSDTRDGLAKTMLGMRSHKGVTGVFKFDEHGHALKHVYILTIDKDRIRLRNSEEEERARGRSP